MCYNLYMKNIKNNHFIIIICLGLLTILLANSIFYLYAKNDADKIESDIKLKSQEVQELKSESLAIEQEIQNFDYNITDKTATRNRWQTLMNTLDEVLQNPRIEETN